MSNQQTIISKDVAIKKRIAEEVFRQQSYLIGYFTKSSVPDMVVTQWAAISLSNPKFLEFLGKEFAKIASSLGKYDLICGIETAGIAIAASVSKETGIPWIYARKNRKPSGSMEAFEGTYHKGDKVIFIDNFSVTGKGMIPIIKHAQEDGLVFNNLLAIIDNEWQKVDEYNSHLSTHALITNRELTYHLNELGYFPGNLYTYCTMYLDEPARLKSGSKDTLNFIEELKKAPNLAYIRKNY